MKLRALRLWNVRKFAGRGIAIEDIGDGVNVLAAENEQGKSTSFDALHALFFQPHSGTPKSVQMLRPYSGGSPQVEVDVETPRGRFRINKQFYSGKRAIVTELVNGRIVAQADEAEAWIADLVRGGSSGPAGLLWVQQGSTEIGGGSTREKDEERKAREDVLSSATGEEIELLTGGRRMVRVLSRTVSNLDRLVTSTAKAKAGGPYAEVSNQLESLRVEEAALSTQIGQLRTALDSRRQKISRLRELNAPDALDHRHLERKQTLAAFEKANTHADKQAIAEANEKLALSKYQAATAKLKDYIQTLEQVTVLREKLIEDEVIHAEALRGRDEATKMDASARKMLEQSDIDLEIARANLEQARLVSAALVAASQLAEIKERLEKAESARNRIETLTAEREAISISAKTVADLESLERKMAVLTARALAESVTLKIDYIDGDHLTITRDGEPVGGGQAHKISSIETFDIPNIGWLTVSPGSGTSLEDSRVALRNAQNDMRRSLTEHGVESVPAAKTRQLLANEKASTILIARAEFDALTPDGIDALRKRHSELQIAAGSVKLCEVDVDAAEAALKLAVASQLDTKTKRETARLALQTARDTFIRVDVAITAARLEFSRIEKELGTAGEKDIALKALQTVQDLVVHELTETSKIANVLRADAPDLESVKAAYIRASSIVDRAQAEASALEKEIAELNGRISISSGHGVEEIYEEVKGKREAAEARIGVFQHEIAALLRLKQALEDARLAAKEQYFGPVLTELKPLLSLLLDDASITFDATTLLPQTLARDGQDEDIAVLSGGMREQLAVLTRLAFARLLAKGGNAVPVILDDALVYSDDIRIERMFDALHRQASDLQILVLTCRQRAFERLGGNGLRFVEWSPSN